MSSATLEHNASTFRWDLRDLHSAITSRGMASRSPLGWSLRDVELRRRRPWLTTGYLLVLLTSTVLLRHLPTADARQLLAGSSTDVQHLTTTPVRVLLTSALWLPDARWLPYAVTFALFMAPLERRVGILRVALVFLSGHVLATLLTELPIAGGIALGWWPAAAAVRLDVGVSYGMYAVIAASAGLLLPRLRWTLNVGLLTWMLSALLLDTDMTAVGHVLSVLIGLGWQPMVQRRLRFPAAAQATVAH